MYSNPAAYPQAADLVNTLATISILENGSSTPSIGTAYSPDDAVIPISGGLSVIKTPLPGGTTERMTIKNIALTLTSGTGVVTIKGDVWASQAANGKNVHCASQGLTFNLNNPAVAGFKICNPRSYTYGITNNSSTTITVFYNLYKDDGDNIFEPGNGPGLDGIAIYTSSNKTIGTMSPQATPEMTTFQDYGVNPYVLTSADNQSTFSLDVDTGSYSLARRWLNDGLMPPPEAVRVEEFVNYFDQGYDIPDNTAFAVYADGAPSPFHNNGTIFVRIGAQGYEVAEVDRDAAALTFVIDVSGSMAEGNRLEIVKESLHTLVDRLRPEDTVAIISYNTSARIVLSPTPANDRNTILNAIYTLSPSGSTNLEEGLLTGYQLANQAYKPGGINRVILASDGVANVGNTTADAILEQSRSYADAGIYLTSIGVGISVEFLDMLESS